MDELKYRATPRINKLIDEAYENDKKLDVSNALADIQITLLSRLCDLKEAQQDGENNRHQDWQNAKIRDTRVSLWVLSCASLAVYLDVIKIDSNGTFIFDLILNRFL